ncbi:hypothetical protein DFH07DRAFT_1031862 [Mycena maculata]|uniref:Uncharacterized protein n=1 Tax=Mycena maculata TaxID=230809 RepID=A0AAD7IX03_9AGAR|nr:hypothetical protein DFH07DRAFT_1031862 [Mycena maculata]
MDDNRRDRNLSSRFHLQRINLRRFNVLLYVLDEAVPVEGSPLPRDSEEPLGPGVYAAFLEGKPYPGQLGGHFYRATFQEREMQARLDIPGLYVSDASEISDYEVPPDIMATALQRDRGVCCLTGRADFPTVVKWIIPPAVANQLYPCTEWDRQPFRTPENTLTLCSALVGPFQENILSVDFEDAARIVTFQDLPSDVPPLLTHLHQPAQAAARFWHRNLKWSLQVHFSGGDVCFEPQDPDPLDLMEELAEDEADLTEDKWHSGVGAEVLAEYMEQRMCLLSGFHSGSEGGPDEERGGSVSDEEEDDDGYLSVHSSDASSPVSASSFI